MSLSVSQRTHFPLNTPVTPNVTKVYMPLPTQVFEKLERRFCKSIWHYDSIFPDLEPITISLDYKNAVTKEELTERIFRFDFKFPFHISLRIIDFIWGMGLTQCEQGDQFRQKLKERNICSCNDDHLLFPEASNIRRYVKMHHSNDMTKSQRHLLVNQLANTRACSLKVFEILNDIRPHRADSLHRSLVSLATIDTSSLDHLIALELKEVTGGTDPEKMMFLGIGDPSSECSDSDLSEASLSPRSSELFNSNSRSFFMEHLDATPFVHLSPDVHLSPEQDQFVYQSPDVHLSPEQDPFERFVDLCSRGHVFQLLKR